MYPDQSLYPANSVPAVVKRINNALLRADQIRHLEGRHHIHWLAPIVADAEAGFGGPLNVFELVKSMIEAGAAGIHCSSYTNGWDRLLIVSESSSFCLLGSSSPCAAGHLQEKRG